MGLCVCVILPSGGEVWHGFIPIEHPLSFDGMRLHSGHGICEMIVLHMICVLYRLKARETIFSHITELFET